MQIETRALSTIKPYFNNPRLNGNAVQPVMNSIKEFGFRQPIVIDNEGVIIVGHTRYAAAQRLGLNEVPVHVATDLSVSQIQAYRLADNRTHHYSGWDEAKLIKEIETLKKANVPLQQTAFTPAEIRAFEHSLRKLTETSYSGEETENAGYERKIVRTQRGDLWLCGEHRVMCGNAAFASDIDQLLQGEQPALGLTDPPYNINYQGHNEQKLTIQNDHLSRDEFEKLMQDSFSHYARVLVPTASLYVFHGWNVQASMECILNDAGFEIRNQLVWAKNHFSTNFGRYHYQHEVLFYAHKRGETDAWYGNEKQTTLLECPKVARNRVHPTMKPLPLLEKMLENSSAFNDVVLDLFGGSGSTMLACERLGRQARLLELSPRYVDATIERWQKVTGKKALHAVTQISFDEVNHDGDS